jgi:hypothetical protein
MVYQIEVNNLTLLHQTDDSATVGVDLVYYYGNDQMYDDSNATIELIWDDSTAQWLFYDKQ